MSDLNYPLLLSYLLPYWSSRVKTWNFQDNEYENDNEIFEMLPNDANKIFFSLIQSHFSIHGRLHTYFVTYLMEMFGAIFFGEIAVFFWFDMRILNQHANDFQIFDLSSQLLYLLLKYELDFVEKIFFWYFSKVVQLFISFIYI